MMKIAKNKERRALNPVSLCLPYCISFRIRELYHCWLFCQIYPYVSVLRRAIHPYSELGASPRCDHSFWPRAIERFRFLDNQPSFIWQSNFKPAVTRQAPCFRYPSVGFLAPSTIDCCDFPVSHATVSVYLRYGQDSAWQCRTYSLPLRRHKPKAAKRPSNR